MDVISIIMLVFSVLGAIDRIFGNKLGLGKEFEKGFMMMGNMALSMIGMLVLAPVIASALRPCFSFVYETFNIDPSIIPAMFFANDMGGAPIAKEIMINKDVGLFNALVVSSMMGATLSFSIPYAVGCVKKHRNRELMLGLLCGIVTIPLGCLVSGIIAKIPFLTLVFNLLPLIVLALILALGLIFIPNVCIKILSVVGVLIKALVTVGLVLGIVRFLTGFEVIKGLDSIENASLICLNASIVMSGAFVLLNVISRILSKPMKKISSFLKINETASLGFISTLATNVTTFEMMNDMDSKGTVLNSAFAVSAAFVFAGHLAFTLAFEPSYITLVIVAKLISGISAVLFATLIYKRVGHTFNEKN